MCGIVGVASEGQVTEKLINGLLRQEYRGYDSSGLAVFGKDSNQVQVIKRAGHVSELQNAIDSVDGWQIERTLEIAADALRLPPWEELVSHLSGGEKRRVALCRLLLSKPDMLLLDEPTAGINPTLINGLIERLKKANSEMGITLFVIEHNMRVIMNLAEHIYCLANGKLLAEGTPNEIQNDQRVIDAYLGGRA